MDGLILLKNFTFYKYIKITSFLLQEVLPSAFQENLSKPTNLNYTQWDSSCLCSSVLYYIEYKLNQTLVWGNPLTGAECHIWLKVKLSHFMHSFASEHKLSSAAPTSVATSSRKKTTKKTQNHILHVILKNIWTSECYTLSCSYSKIMGIMVHSKFVTRLQNLDTRASVRSDLAYRYCSAHFTKGSVQTSQVLDTAS